MTNGFVLLADGFDGLMIGKIDTLNWTMFPFGIAALFLNEVVRFLPALVDEKSG